MNDNSGKNIWRAIKIAAIILCGLFLYSVMSFLIFWAVGMLFGGPDPRIVAIGDVLVASLSATVTLLYFRRNKMLAAVVFFFSIFVSPLLVIPVVLFLEALRL